VLDSRIFISYRHADSAAYAGRMYDRLKDRYGDEQVFRDLEMDLGIDFVERIDDTVGSCAVMVVVIGPGWLNARDDAGERRLDDPDDYVRVEISSALRRSIRVIPVLVGEARMPGKNDLPDDVRALARRNALQISDSRWDYDIGRLIQAVNTVLQDRQAPVAARRAPTDGPRSSVVAQPPPSPTPAPERESVPPTARSSPLRPALIAVVAAALAAPPAYFLANWLYKALSHKQASSWDLVVRRASYQGAYWALIAGAVAACVALATRHRSPARALLNGLVVGAVVGGLSGALDQILRNNDFKRNDFLVALIMLGGVLGASGVAGARGMAAAAGGLSGGALAAVLDHHLLAGHRLTGLFLAAVLIIAGVWAAERLRLRTAAPPGRTRSLSTRAPGPGKSQFGLPGREDE
jgi:TIR domain